MGIASPDRRAHIASGETFSLGSSLSPSLPQSVQLRLACQVLDVGSHAEPVARSAGHPLSSCRLAFDGLATREDREGDAGKVRLQVWWHLDAAVGIFFQGADIVGAAVELGIVRRP